MMPNFSGIPPEGLFLLLQNQFENSKEFYDAHKVELKRLVMDPMGQIVENLSQTFSALDSELLLTPSKTVSRLRRDTRFTNDKTLYRANVWFCVTRPRVEFPHVWPILWFELKPEESLWNAGVALWDSPPAYMRFLRERILANPDEFLTAAEQAMAAGAQRHTEPYKKDRAPDAPEALKAYLNAKHFYFMVTSDNMVQLKDHAIVEHLQKIYTGYAAMYHWLRQSAEAYISVSEL